MAFRPGETIPHRDLSGVRAGTDFDEWRRTWSAGHMASIERLERVRFIVGGKRNGYRLPSLPRIMAFL
jgi:hypothetical protein